MGQVGSVCACNRSQPLALPGEKALPLGHPHRRNFGIRNGDLFGEALMPGNRSSHRKTRRGLNSVVRLAQTGILSTSFSRCNECEWIEVFRGNLSEALSGG